METTACFIPCPGSACITQSHGRLTLCCQRARISWPPARAETSRKVNLKTEADHLSCRPFIAVRLLLVLCALLQGLPMDPAGASAVDTRIKDDTTEKVIQNKPLRYGNYCGPGPAELNPSQGCSMLPRLPAVDQVDQGCLLHDQAYCKCRGTLESRGKPFPPALLPVIAVRGELPEQVGGALLDVDREFSMCIHEADERLAKDFKAAAARLPEWWDNTALAPRGAEGTKGFREACALGVGPQCVLPSKQLFFRLKQTFDKALLLDSKAGIQPRPATSASPAPAASQQQ